VRWCGVLRPRCGQPNQIPGRPHGGGTDEGLREHAAAAQGGDLGGIDLVAFRLATADGLRVEGMPRDEGDPFLRAEVGESVSDEQAFNREDNVGPTGCKVPEKRLPAGLHVPMQQDLAILLEDADVHGPGVHVDAIAKLGLLGVESQQASSSGCACFPVPASYGGTRGRGPESVSMCYSGRRPQGRTARPMPSPGERGC
jgi:hypothetical protein